LYDKADKVIIKAKPSKIIKKKNVLNDKMKVASTNKNINSQSRFPREAKLKTWRDMSETAAYGGYSISVSMRIAAHARSNCR